MFTIDICQIVLLFTWAYQALIGWRDIWNQKIVLIYCNAILAKSKCSLPEVGLDEQLSKEQTTKAVNVLINNMITASCFVVNQWLIVVSWKQATSSSRPLMYIWIQTIALINKGVQCVGKNARINWKFINIYDINSKRYEIISQ